MALKTLALRSCHVSTPDYEADLKGLVGKITWDSVMHVCSDNESETEETDSDEFDGFGYWGYERGYYY